MGKCASKPNPRGNTEAVVDDSVLGLLRKRPGHCEVGGKPLLHPASGDFKYTVVLDIDECLLLAKGRGGKRPEIFKRPFLKEFVEGLGELKGVEVVLWTSGTLLQSAISWSEIDPEKQVISQVIWRTKKWVTEDPCGLVTDPVTGTRMRSYKDLTLLGRDVSHTIIIDNAPQNCLSQPSNCIIVPEYDHPDPSDTTLPAVLNILRGLSESGETVPEYLDTHSALAPCDLTITMKNSKQQYSLRKLKEEPTTPLSSA